MHPHPHPIRSPLVTNGPSATKRPYQTHVACLTRASGHVGNTAGHVGNIETNVPQNLVSATTLARVLSLGIFSLRLTNRRRAGLELLGVGVVRAIGI